MKRILMVAYHFPPLTGSSGIQRTLRFAKYLPEFGWEPIILTAHPRAYERVSSDMLGEIPRGIVVVRAPAFDASRHFSIKGRYPGILARPDRWVSWLPGGTVTGLATIRRYKPDLIWSTYPIATAHMIGTALHRLSGLPWIADFRDPMAHNGYPSDPRVRASFIRIEENVVNHARLCVFTTPGAARFYAQRYPATHAKFHVVENGYDEETFIGEVKENASLNPGKLTLLHSGVVYPSERDPTQFFRAIRDLLNMGRIRETQFRIRFRAAMHKTFLEGLIKEFDLSQCMELLPPIPYADAIEEMLRADVLLIMQASNCNDQIPAKLYEYLRAERPILALTDPDGDTAGALRQAGISTIVPLDQPNAIGEILARMLHDPATGALPDKAKITAYSRRNLTGKLAELLSKVA